jgi:La-related protein 7
MAQESSVDVAAAAAAEAATPSPFKFNVHAPEFVPMSSSPAASPMSATAGSYYSPFMQMHPDWNFFSAEHEPAFFMPDFTHAAKFGATTSNSAQGKATTTDVA